jgi:hypothetical protein
MPIVYISQMRTNALGDPVFDTEDAERYGEIVYLLSPTAHVGPGNAEKIKTEIRDKLADYHDHDFLILTGNPIIMTFTALIAADMSNTGKINVLQWNRARRCYAPIVISS